MGDDGICSRREKVQGQPSPSSHFLIPLWSCQHPPLTVSSNQILTKTTCCLARGSLPLILPVVGPNQINQPAGTRA